MKVTQSFFADTIIRDAERNTITAVDLLDHFDIRMFPAALPRLSLCFMIEREEGDDEQNTMELKLIGPQGEHMFPVQVNFDGKPRSRIIMRFEGYVVFQPGRILAELRKGETVVGTCQIHAINAVASNPPDVAVSN